MKNLFLLLVFFCFQMSFAQAEFQIPAAEPSFQIESPVVREAYAKLAQRAAVHGKDLHASLKDKIALVQVVPKIPCEGHAPHPDGDLGMAIPGEQFVVVLSQISLEDTNSLERSLAHELGHVLLMEHTSPPLADGTFRWEVEIMSGGSPSNPTHLLYQLMNHPVYSVEMWENYFNQPQFVNL